MLYFDVETAEAVDAGVLTPEEVDWLKNLRIPYADPEDKWLEKRRLDALMVKAIAEGRVKPIEKAPIIVEQRGPYGISDYINGPGGAVKSMADGKMYDSKSEYYKSLKRQGYVVMGDDAPTTAKQKEIPLCDRDIGRDVKTAIQQLEGRL